MSETQTAPVLKKYVLLDALNATAPIFNVIPGGKKLRIDKIPSWRPFLQITFVGKDNKNKTIRYKESHNSIYQADQIKDGILANERYTTAERKALYFRNGFIATMKPISQEFLDTTPQNVAFEGMCDIVPAFRLLDEKGEAKLTNEDLRRRAKAATKIFDLDLSGAQSMIIRLNGTFVKPPDDIVECQNLLIDFLDDSEEGGVDAILKEDKDIDIDELTSILIGKLVSANYLSFDAVEGSISKKDKKGKYVAIRTMSPEYTVEQRQSMFSDFLNSNDGKALKKDLETELAAMEKKHEN